MFVKSEIEKWFWKEASDFAALTFLGVVLMVVSMAWGFIDEQPLAIAPFFFGLGFGWIGASLYGKKERQKSELLKEAEKLAKQRARSKIGKAWKQVFKNDKIDRRRAVLLEARNALNDGLSLDFVNTIVQEERPQSGFYSRFFGVELKFGFEKNFQTEKEKSTPPYAKLLLVRRTRDTARELASISLI